MKRKKEIIVAVVVVIITALGIIVGSTYNYKEDYEKKLITIEEALKRPDPTIKVEGNIDNLEEAVQLIADVKRNFPRYYNMSYLEIAKRLLRHNRQFNNAYLIMRKESDQTPKDKFDVLTAVPVEKRKYAVSESEMKELDFTRNVVEVWSLLAVAGLLYILVYLIILVIRLIKFLIKPEGKALIARVTTKEFLIRVVLALLVIYLSLLIVAKVQKAFEPRGVSGRSSSRRW